MTRSVVLLSGGLDSATCLALVTARGDRVVALSFDYGQRHRIELERARTLAARAGVERHFVLPLPVGALGGSALTDPALEVPKNALSTEPEANIPTTYVPARNTIFLAYAMAVAEVTEADRIVIGANALDYSGYPDCRPAFLEAFERVANLGTRVGVTGERPLRIEAPLLHLSKADIVRRADELGVDFASTSSCYDPSPTGAPCGACDSCLLRKRGFEDAGITDSLYNK